MPPGSWRWQRSIPHTSPLLRRARLAASAILKKPTHTPRRAHRLLIVNAVIVPRTAADVSRRLYPTPTAFEFARQVEHDTYDGLPTRA